VPHYPFELVQLGERAFATKPGDLQSLSKIDMGWEAGIWVGKTETLEKHLVSTPEFGASRMRVVRRRQPSERWSLVELTSLRAAPWDLK
jgi:hypothetical protein